MAELTAELVKRRAKELGADLVGIASAATLNAFPPDPRWPQTPERISPYCQSVIVLVQRIPAGAFRCKTNVPVQYINMLVLRKMDKVAYRLAEELEDAGHPTFTAAQETDWSYKRASYGRLSTRHLGVEAGLGTLGLEVNILTPEFGPRVYLAGILTELELEPDRPLTEQVCIGEFLQPLPARLSGRRRAAFRHRQARLRHRSAGVRVFYHPAILRALHRCAIGREGAGSARSRDVYGFWQGLLRVVGSFGDCPRCLAVCPVGNDYHAHLADTQKAIPEKTLDKVALGKSYRENRVRGAEIAGLNDWNRRWVGPEGYKGMVARQLQEFKKAQQERAQEALVAADESERN